MNQWTLGSNLFTEQALAAPTLILVNLIFQAHCNLYRF